MTGRQIEFGLGVAVCAWCKPGERSLDATPLSHGICLRHLNKLKLEAQGIVTNRLKPRRRKVSPVADAAVDLLALPF
jgi:hypothetical protein